MEIDDLVRRFERQDHVLTAIQVSLAKVETDLRHHIEGVKQNRHSIQRQQEDLDKIADAQLSLQSLQEGQARVFKWASLVLGAVSMAVGILYTLQRLSG